MMPAYKHNRVPEPTCEGWQWVMGECKEQAVKFTGPIPLPDEAPDA